jgi:tetratricopeptide (TPR) repeat protein
VVCHLESTVILESQIALGVDPTEVSKWVALAIAGELVLLTFWAVRLRRFLLASGELRLSGSTLTLVKEMSALIRDTVELQCITSYPGGANVEMAFPAGKIRLPGQWLPLGWKLTWRGWRTPDGASVRLRRKTHPLLVALRSQRADLKPRLAGIWVEIIAGLLSAVLPEVGSLPLYMAARRGLDRPRVEDTATRQFQEGRYIEACETYKRALPGLRYDLYATQYASEFLLYCGDFKAAVQAFLAFDVQPLWPFPPDPEVLARIRISRGRYKQAEELLRGRPSYLLYVALVEQGRRIQADEVLNQIQSRNRLAHVLLLRHRGLQDQAKAAADTLSASFHKHEPQTPSWLARAFESSILSVGASKTAEDPRFAPAIRDLPGLRTELIRFTEREAPESAENLKLIIRKLEHRN